MNATNVPRWVRATGAGSLVLCNGRLHLPDGRTLDLRRSPVSRNLVHALIELHHTRPGATLDTEALIARTWPGERMLAHAARNRLWVAVARLRSQGLEGVIAHRGEGYFIPPEVPVEIQA